MKYLLDTHILLWYIEGELDLSNQAREIIESAESTKYVSVATLWEIAIKLSIDKLTLTKPFEIIPEFININGFVLLPILPKHLFEIKKLTHYYKDPFDRLLIAQAISENMTIISADKIFNSYPVNVAW